MTPHWEYTLTHLPFGLATLVSTLQRLALLALLLAGCAAEADTPARAGRIAQFTGSVRYFDEDSGAWRNVARNQTVAMGERLQTDAHSRLAVRIGSGALWLDERSEILLSVMDDEQLTLHLLRGTIALRLASAELAQQTRILTGEGTITPESDGLYRVEQWDQITRALTLQGRLRFESHRTAGVERAWLRVGEQMEFGVRHGSRGEPQIPVPDAFSEWIATQMQSVDNIASESFRFVSPEMTGAEELASHGRWEQTAEYGPLWTPYQVEPDWSPFSRGHWRWTSQWGWSWVDDMPWGFAPFHYGQWVQWRGGWRWSPGTYVRRPIYAPSLGNQHHTVRPPADHGWRRPVPRGTDSPSHRLGTGETERWSPPEHRVPTDRQPPRGAPQHRTYTPAPAVAPATSVHQPRAPSPSQPTVPQMRSPRTEHPGESAGQDKRSPNVPSQDDNDRERRNKRIKDQER